MGVFMYYSLTGSGELVADYLKNKEIETRRVVSKRGLPKSFFWQVMIGGMLAGMKHKAKLKDFNFDLSNQENVIIGSPVWNGKLSCPVNTVLSKIDLTAKNLTFVLYSGSGNSPKLVSKLNKKYPNARIIELKDPKKYRDELNRLASLV